MEFDVDSVSLSFAATDTSFIASNFDLTKLVTVGRKIDVKDAKEYEHKYKLGLEEASLSRTFLFTVKDENNSKKYTAVVKRTIDFSLKNFSLKIGDKTVDVDPEKLEAVKVPATVNFVDIEVEADPVSNLVTAVKSVVGTDGSYVARVRLYVKGRADEGEEKYEVSLLTPSGDASLKRLLVTPGELAPAFDPETYEYSVSVPHVQDFIYFVTELSNEYASVSGAGEQELAVGENHFTVTVTAENETKKEYHITVFRADDETGILPLSASSAQVYISGGVLHISASLAERIDVYTASGSLLYSLDKPAGKVSLQGLPKGILIVKGGSGWVRKVAI